MTYEAITAEMMAALGDEMDAMKRGHGGRQIPLQNGRSAGYAADRHLYLFDLASELAVPDDTPAQLKVGEEVHTVTIVAVDGFEVTLALPYDLGERIPVASLSTSPWYLLQILITRLEESLASKRPLNRDVAMMLFNLAPNKTLSPVAQPDFGPRGHDGSGFAPNDEQRAAVTRALSQVITFIWGPPGTGKTTTINYLVPALVCDSERVFITSHTNAAVDAVLKAAKKGLTPQQIRDGTIIRVGQVKEKDPEIEEITLDAVLERRGSALNAQLAALGQQCEGHKRSLNKWTTTKAQLEKVGKLESARDADRRRLDAGHQSVKNIEQMLDQLKDAKSLLDKKLVQAEAAGVLRRIFTGLYPERVLAQLESVQAQQSNGRAELKKALDGLPTLEAAVTASERTVENARSALGRPGSIPTLSQVLDEIAKCDGAILDIERQVAAVNQELQALAQRVVKEAAVVGATLTKLSTTQELYENQCENLIVDEASMVAQPHLWFASSLASKRVVILGDFRQLQPICIAQDSPAALKRIARSVYQEAGIVDDSMRVNLDDSRLVALRKQYRMHAVIGELANELVYRKDGNALEHCAPESLIAVGLSGEPVPGTPAVLCDTSSANPWCARLEPGYSRYNIYSAVTAVRVAEQVVKSVGNRAVSVGIVSPYSAQARLLRMLVAEHGLSETVKAATVHSFQGGEKDVVIVDLVDGPPFPNPGVLLTKPESRNLLNVAFSRAKGKVILVSHSAYLESHSRGEALEITQSYFGRRASFVDSRQLLKGYADSEVLGHIQSPTGAPSGNPEGMSLFNESTFYKRFLQDLQGAKKQVIIFSPFVQPGRSATLIPVLRGLVERGTQVVVITRPSRRSTPRDKEDVIDTDNASESVVEELKRIGIKVSTRPYLHEKLAFIDSHVTWMGSLNILSHSETTEQMTRFDNHELTAMFIEFNGIAALFRKEEHREKQMSRLQLMGSLLAKRMATPRCPRCGRQMVLRFGPYGAFFGCPNYPADKETVAIPKSVLSSIVDEMDIPCPKCKEGQMRLRSGPKGVFLGCDRYPDCRTTEPMG